MCYLNTILKYTLKLSREARRKFLSKYLEADAKKARNLKPIAKWRGRREKGQEFQAESQVTRQPRKSPGISCRKPGGEADAGQTRGGWIKRVDGWDGGAAWAIKKQYLTHEGQEKIERFGNF